MNYRSKYGEWALILGATEGIGKAFAIGAAERGMDVVLVGRREEKLKDLGEEISAKYNVKHKVVKADFSEADSADLVINETKDLDIGLMSFIACLHKLGKLQDSTIEEDLKILQVNVITFTKFMQHFSKLFGDRDRGAIINMSSLTAVTSSPYNSQYGACKAYILKMTEAVAYEFAKTNVDVEVVTAGSTLTPSYLKNLPGGPAGEKARSNAMKPEEVAKIAFENLGKVRSVIAGEVNNQAVKHWHTNMTADDMAEYMGKFYE